MIGDVMEYFQIFVTASLNADLALPNDLVGTSMAGSVARILTLDSPAQFI